MTARTASGKAHMVKFPICLEPEEHEKMMKEVKRRGLNRSLWVRLLIKQALERDKKSKT